MGSGDQMMRALILKNLIGSTIAALVFLLVIFVAIPTLKGYEEDNYPVLSLANLEAISVVNGKVHMYLIFEKLRSCKFLHLDATQDGKRVGYVFKEDLGKKPISRDTGKQSIGPVELNTDNIDNLKITVVHSCNLLYDTRSKLYPSEGE